MWCDQALEMRDKCFKSRLVFTISCISFIMISGKQHPFCLCIRSSSGTTSRTKPSPSGCTALSLWWGLWKESLIRRCHLIKQGSTHYSAQTVHHTSPFSHWVRPCVLLFSDIHGESLISAWAQKTNNTILFPFLPLQCVMLQPGYPMEKGQGQRSVSCWKTRSFLLQMSPVHRYD